MRKFKLKANNLYEDQTTLYLLILNTSNQNKPIKYLNSSSFMMMIIV